MRSIDARRELAHPHPHPEWFSGPVWIQELNDAPEATGLEIFAVFFDPGARTLPHTHSTDQLLYFLDGEGVVGTQGDPSVPAGWHGGHPCGRMALARRSPDVGDLPSVDPAGRPVRLGPRRSDARLGYVYGWCEGRVNEATGVTVIASDRH